MNERRAEVRRFAHAGAVTVLSTALALASHLGGCADLTGAPGFLCVGLALGVVFAVRIRHRSRVPEILPAAVGAQLLCHLGFATLSPDHVGRLLDVPTIGLHLVAAVGLTLILASREALPAAASGVFGRGNPPALVVVPALGTAVDDRPTYRIPSFSEFIGTAHPLRGPPSWA